MAHIEVETDDLTLFSKKAQEMNVKLDNMKNILDTKFSRAKENDLYIDGFNKIRNYLEAESDKVKGLEKRVDKYQSNVINIEKTYSSIFNDIAVPGLQTLLYGATTQEQTPVAVPDTSPVIPVVNPTNEIEEKPNVSPVVQEVPITSNNTVDPPNTNLTSNSSGGFNSWGALAGLTGAIGAASIGTATALYSKNKNRDEEEEETSYEINESNESNELSETPLYQYQESPNSGQQEDKIISPYEMLGEDR